jgi:hypothetical protein
MKTEIKCDSMYYIDQIKNFKNIQVLILLSFLYFTNYNLAALTVTFSFPKCFKTSCIVLELKHTKPNSAMTYQN